MPQGCTDRRSLPRLWSFSHLSGVERSLDDPAPVREPSIFANG